MARSQVEKEATHRRIVKAAAAQIRRDGVDAVTVAILTLSALVGAVAMSRAVDDPELSDEILTRTGNALHRRAYEAAG
jgi:hypothetical protein